MKDYEYLFATTLHQKLKEKIVGSIFVKVTTNDELFIIIDSFGDIKYKLWFDHFSERIVNGWSTDYAVYDVLSQYRKFINDRYFK